MDSPNGTAHLGALRSKTVAKLAGVTLRQLGYWHRTKLIRAHVVPGARGYPRLYSWVDYMKVRAARSLIEQDVATRQLRAAIGILDADVPEWYLRPLFGFERKVYITLDDVTFHVGRARQVLLHPIIETLQKLEFEGPLGELRAFSDVVDMHPQVVSGNPVVKGTRLETRFLANLEGLGVSEDSIAQTYHLDPQQVRRAVEFDRLAA